MPKHSLVCITSTKEMDNKMTETYAQSTGDQLVGIPEARESKKWVVTGSGHHGQWWTEDGGAPSVWAQ